MKLHRAGVKVRGRGNKNCTSMLQEKEKLKLGEKIRSLSYPQSIPVRYYKFPPKNHIPFLCTGSLFRIFSSIPSRDLIAEHLDLDPEAPSFLFYLLAATSN